MIVNPTGNFKRNQKKKMYTLIIIFSKTEIEGF